MTREQQVLERYSTLGLKRNTLDRVAKREQLERLNVRPNEIVTILNDLYGPEPEGGYKMNEPLFQPFQPAPSVQPGNEPQPPKAKRSRKRAVAMVNPPPPKLIPPGADLQPPPKRRGRKPGTPNKLRQPSGLQPPVATMLAAMSKLRGDDSALFEKLLGILAAAGKGQRDRVLAALAQVF